MFKKYNFFNLVTVKFIKNIKYSYNVGPLNVGRCSGSEFQLHFIKWIISGGVSSGRLSSAGRSPFRTHWQIWSSLLASEQRNKKHFGLPAACCSLKTMLSVLRVCKGVSFITRLNFKPTCIWLLLRENDPNHNGEAVNIRFLSGDGVDAVQVLWSHVAQCAGSSGAGGSPLLAPSAGLLLREPAPRLAGGQSKVCNLTTTTSAALTVLTTNGGYTLTTLYLDVKILVHQNVFRLKVFVYDVAFWEVHHCFQDL